METTTIFLLTCAISLTGAGGLSETNQVFKWQHQEISMMCLEFSFGLSMQ